jgi:crossover junction endonuclease MUS81
MEFSKEIIIDNRETKLKEYFNEKENFSFENLDIGDIIVKKNDEIFLAIERKSLKDMAQSINDGRWREQRTRMLNNMGDKSMYIIEGGYLLDETGDDIGRVSQKTLKSAIINLLIRDNIRVYFSKDMEDTIKFIESIYEKLDDIEKSRETNNFYLNNVKIKKKANVDSLNCFIMQLATIPGVSVTAAKEISGLYKNMNELILEYNKKESDKEKLLMLSKIKVGSKSLGPKLSEKIYKLLIGID